MKNKKRLSGLVEDIIENIKEELYHSGDSENHVVFKVMKNNELVCIGGAVLSIETVAEGDSGDYFTEPTNPVCRYFLESAHVEEIYSKSHDELPHVHKLLNELLEEKEGLKLGTF